MDLGVLQESPQGYAPEEFVDSNFEDPSFRYNLYWKQSGQWKLDGYNWKMTGFKNTSDRAISSKEEAISRAAEELGYESPVGVTFYDETCGYWMVELYENDASYTGLTGNELYSRLRRTVQTVILDDKGRTVEIYDSLTRYVAFASAGSTSEMN